MAAETGPLPLKNQKLRHLLKSTLKQGTAVITHQQPQGITLPPLQSGEGQLRHTVNFLGFFFFSMQHKCKFVRNISPIHLIP